MCGISGIISGKAVPAKAIVDSLHSIKYRGLEDTLLYSDNFYSCSLSSEHSQQKYKAVLTEQESKTWFGFNRLCIVDLSPQAMQPFYSPETDTVFMCNGEIYNHKELRNKYLGDVSFTSSSDCEVAFRLYLKLGKDFINDVKGMFSIVIYDGKNHKLMAWRDRFGMKPLLYAFDGETFVFSSEAKGIWNTGLVKKELDYKGLAYSMYLGTCPSPITIYKNINSLQPAHGLEYDVKQKSVSVTPYWKLQYNPQRETIGFDEFSKDIERVCNQHLIDDLRKGVMLSGGLDSGLMAYYLAKGDKTLKTFNIFAENHVSDEREYAHLNAEKADLSLECYEISDNPSPEEIVPYLTAEEEPNTVPEPAFFLSLKANEQGMKVLYCALGPDEVFGGYDYYKKVAKLGRWEGIVKLLPSFIFPDKYRGKITDIKKYGLKMYPLISRQTFSWAEIKEIIGEERLKDVIHPIEFIEQQIKDLHPDYDKLPLLKKVSLLDIHYYISSHHVFRFDQSSMKHTVEMRFPLLDADFIQKYFNQAKCFDDIMKDPKPQWRSYAKHILPGKVFDMQKKGFGMLVEKWVSVLQKDEKLTSNSSYPFLKYRKWNESDTKKWYKMSLEKLFE